MDEQVLKDLKHCLILWRNYEKSLVKAGLPGPMPSVAVGWKVADLASFESAVKLLLPKSEQTHIGTVNERFIASFVLKQPLEVEEIPIIKLLQRRPGSNDLVGLDHMDFLCKDMDTAKDALGSANANWQEESNDVHTWLSVRFGEDLEYEAKLLDHTVLRAGITELQTSEKEILSRFKENKME